MPHKLVKTCDNLYHIQRDGRNVLAIPPHLSDSYQSQILSALNAAYAAGRYRGEDDKAAELRRARGVIDAPQPGDLAS